MRFIRAAVIVCAMVLLSAMLIKACGQSPKKPNVEKTKDGNYIEIVFSDTLTGKTYTDKKGVIYPVYRTENDKIYVWILNQKSGKKYRKYLKVK